MMAFIATNGVADNYDPVDPPNDNATGDYDLMPWNVEDIADQTGGAKRRKMYYNVYNTGTKTVMSGNR